MPLRINALSLFILPRLFVQVWGQSDLLFEKDRAFVIIRRIDVKMQAAKSDWRNRTKLKEIAFVLRFTAIGVRTSPIRRT